MTAPTRRRAARRLALATAWAAAALAACRGDRSAGRAAPASAPDAAAPPLTARVVAVDGAPALNETGKSSRPLELLPRGFVVEVVAPYRELTWAKDGLTRSGALVQVQRSHQDGTVFVFEADLGATVTPPDGASLCAAVPEAAAGCADRLRRWQQGDALFGWDACQRPGCALVRARGSERAGVRLDGLILAWPALVGERAYLVARTHVNPEPGLTIEEELVFPAASPALSPAARVVIDRIDSRGAVVTRRQGAVVVDGARLVFRGQVTEVRAADGVELSRTPVEEAISLGE